MGKLYKYMSAEIADKFFIEDKQCTLKFSHLQDYNDPFEFFLTIDYDQKPDVLAFYNEIVSMVVKTPVTCFSKSPIITPMWAHYGSNSEGFVAEIDEDALRDWMTNEMSSDFSFNDITYRDEPSEGMDELLQRAFVIGKFRYIAWLRDAISSAAYFTKQTCWSYEQERRFVIDSSLLSAVSDSVTVLRIPFKAVTGIIVGANASGAIKNTLKKSAEEVGCQYYEKRFGRSSTKPYFIDSDTSTYEFNGNKIVAQKQRCTVCYEPTKAKVGTCAWCQITTKEKEEGARRNSFRTLVHYGILEQYMENFRAVGKKNK